MPARRRRGVVTGEVYVDQVELTRPVCRGGEEVLARLRRRCVLAPAGGARIHGRRRPPDGASSAVR